MEAKLSQNVKRTVKYSRDEAIRLHNGAIGVEHIFLGMLRTKECTALRLLMELNVDIATIRTRIETTIGKTEENVRFNPDSELPMLRQSEKVLRLSFLESTKLKSSEIHTEHLLLAILHDAVNNKKTLDPQFMRLARVLA